MRKGARRVLALGLGLAVVGTAWSAPSLEKGRGRKNQSDASAGNILGAVDPTARLGDQTNPNGRGARRFDPNRPWRDERGRMTPSTTAQDIVDGRAGMDALRRAAAKNPPDERAWDRLSPRVQAMLAWIGITKSNWQTSIAYATILPKRTQPVRVVDKDRSTAVVYETQLRPQQVTKTRSEPIRVSYNSCGCHGTYVAGYRTIHYTTTEMKPTQVAVAQKTPVMNVAGIEEPYSATQKVPRQVTESYQVKVPVYVSYNSCGCHGTYLAGWRHENRTRQVTVYDDVPYTAFSKHLPDNYKPGDGKKRSNTYIAGAEGNTSVGDTTTEIRLSTNDDGSLKAGHKDAGGKAKELAGGLDKGGAPIKN